MQSADFAKAVVLLLHQYDDVFSEPSLRQLTKDCRDEIYADNIAHGGSIEDPFFNFVLLNGVAIFTFFEISFSIYAVRCNESEVISETDEFELSDTTKCKAFLIDKYHKLEPDLVVTRSVCEHWLDS